MATKVAYTLREDKQGLQKQLGCMNGIFQLFDRRYLLGLHRCRSQNRLTQGQSENGEKEFKNSSEKAKEKNQKKVIIEKNRVSVESSRNSFSSSCSSTTFSSFDCSKRVQTEWQIPSEPTSPNSHKKQPDCSLQPPDIRDLVKDSMTREIRVTKGEQVGPVMHIDSPRPFLHQKSIQYDRKDQNLTKIKKISSKEVKEISRFSCDDRESQYSLKSSFKVKELPRLSLDSKQNSNKNSMNESRSEPGSNNRSSSGVVARLMGLESLTTDSISEVETIKIKPVFSDPLVSGSRWSRQGDKCKHNHVSVSPRVYLKQEGADLGYKQPSVYGEMEKRLSALEFKASGKDLRALKQILEAMQMTKTGFENKERSLDIHKTDQIGSPTVKGTSSPKIREFLNRGVKPAKMATESMIVIGLHKVNRKARKQVKDQTPKNNISKATGRTPRSLSPSSPREYQTKEKPVSSPRLQKSKNGIDKECFKRPSSDLSRVKKQSDLNTRHPKIKLTDPMQNNKQSRRYSNEKRNISQDGHTVSLKSESKQGATRGSENNFDERLIEDKPRDELAKLTMKQASPVSVLDAFYVEEIPSPVKKKQNAFNDYDNLHVDETEWNQAGIYNLMNTMDADNIHEIEFLKSTDREAIVSEIVKSPCKSTNGDHLYINEILLASGFLQDPDSAVRKAQLHSTGSLIQPELFDILEKPNDECHNKNPSSKYNEKIRRRMIFDSVNDILFHKLANSGFSGKRCRRLVNGDKLLRELWSEIDNVQSSSERCEYDEDDEVKNLVSADVNKNLEGWERCCYDVSGLVLDIERLIFKDLIDEVVNADATGAQHRPGRHCRRLFSM